MKQQIEQLIDRLADKSLTKGCRIKAKYWEYELELVGDEEYGDGFRYYMPAGGQLHELVESEIVEILGHPILIGDVLEKIEILLKGKFGEVKLGASYASMGSMQYQWEYWLADTSSKLLKLWRACGFTKSLQSFFEECEWEGACPLHPSHIPSIKSNQAIPVGICTDCWNLSVSTNLIQIPKQKPIRDLFEFILSLNLAE